MSDLSSVFGSGFDSNQELPPSPFDLVAPGWYTAIIEKSEVKQTSPASKSAGNGHYINAQFSVLEGPHKGRKVFKKFNIQNPSQEAVNIGLRELQKLNQSLGIAIFKDTDQHLSQCVQIKIVVKDEQNDIRDFKPLGNKPQSAQTYPPGSANYETKSNAPTPAPAQNTASTPGLALLGNKPPWMR